MKTIHVSSSYPLGPGDPTAPFMEEMLAALVARGHDVRVLVPSTGGLTNEVRRGVSVIAVDIGNNGSHVWGHGRSLSRSGRIRLQALLSTPRALTSLAQALRDELKKDPADIVHLHWILPQGLLAFVVPRHIPVVVSAHGADIPLAVGRFKRLARMVLGRTAALISASSHALEILGAVTPESCRSRMILHGADATLFAGAALGSSRRALGLHPADRVILAVGRMVEKKGFHLLVEAFASLSTASSRLVIVGDGPEMNRLRAIAASLDLTDRTIFPGFQDREQVSTWMAASDIVVVPSIPTRNDIDTGPVVLVESLAAGRPVVATPVGIAREILTTGENGVLADPDPQSIAVGIETVLADLDAYKERAARSFDHLGGWERWANEVETLYEDVVKGTVKAS